MKLKTTKTKEEIRREMRLTRPPRMEGAVKEAMMQPVRKKKRIIPRTVIVPKERRGYTEKQIKDYQLRSKKH